MVFIEFRIRRGGALCEIESGGACLALAESRVSLQVPIELDQLIQLSIRRFVSIMAGSELGSIDAGF